VNYHPAAELFPLMQGADFAELVADMAEHGQREEIVTYDGLILDGRNRYRACQELGLAPVYREWDGVGDPVAYVLSMNLHRRHLTSSQRAVLALDVLPMLESKARERQGERNDLTLLNSLSNVDRNDNMSTAQAATMTGTNRQYVNDAARIAERAPELLDDIRNGEMTIPQAKQVIARQRQPAPAVTPAFPPQVYRCIVIDPPWPVVKIEREERPNQGIELDYPTMTHEAIADLPIDTLADPAGCHVYLWTTQKHLPSAFALFTVWGVHYQCLMTWVKPTGMTPYSWMYNTEHVLFGRIGSLPLLRMGLKLAFDAPVVRHSQKPDVFYERVLAASPGPRLDMFARQARDGFTAWGNEVTHG